jgi:hypothetical protein
MKIDVWLESMRKPLPRNGDYFLNIIVPAVIMFVIGLLLGREIK